MLQRAGGDAAFAQHPFARAAESRRRCQIFGPAQDDIAPADRKIRHILLRRSTVRRVYRGDVPQPSAVGLLSFDTAMSMLVPETATAGLEVFGDQNIAACRTVVGGARVEKRICRASSRCRGKERVKRSSRGRAAGRLVNS